MFASPVLGFASGFFKAHEVVFYFWILSNRPFFFIFARKLLKIARKIKLSPERGRFSPVFSKSRP